MADQMEILLKAERKPEEEKLLGLLSEMSQAEQKEMLVFMQGVRFAKGIGGRAAQPPEEVVQQAV